MSAIAATVTFLKRNRESSTDGKKLPFVAQQVLKINKDQLYAILHPEKGEEGPWPSDACLRKHCGGTTRKYLKMSKMKRLYTFFDDHRVDLGMDAIRVDLVS